MRLAGIVFCIALLGTGPTAFAYDQGPINPNDPSGGGRWLTVGSYTLPNTHKFLMQLDESSIQKEGGFTTYWTRTWDVSAKRPADFFGQEQLLKRAFDCENMRSAIEALQGPFGSVPLAKVTWKDTDRSATFDLVCGKSVRTKVINRYRRVAV
jgi:hypothetical protein